MKENKSLVTGIVVLAVVVIGYVLWVSYAHKKVREVVDNSLKRIEERMEAGGNDVTITYDDVKVHSFSLRPHASVYKLHVKIEDGRRREVHLALPEVVYTPKSLNMRSYKLEVLDSVTMIGKARRQNQETTLIDFSTAPTLHVNEKANGDVLYALDVPQHVSLTEASEGQDPATADKTDITFEGTRKVEWTANSHGVTLDQSVSLPRTVITHAGEELATIEGLSIDTRHSEVDGGLHRYATLAKLENLTFAAEELQVLNPVSLVNDFTYTGPLVLPGAEEVPDAPQHLQLKNVAWMTGLMSVFANGEIRIDPEHERLPHGNISLRFDDVDAFLAYVENQRPKTRAFLNAVRGALEKISGASLERNGTVTINVNRKPNERLYIGELSLEESFGLFIELAMQLPDFSSEGEDGAEFDGVPDEDDVEDFVDGIVDDAVGYEYEDDDDAEDYDDEVEIEIDTDDADISIKITVPENAVE